MRSQYQKPFVAATLALAGAGTIMVVATAKRVHSNRVDWARNGFFGMPIRVQAEDSAGEKVEVILRSSTTEPPPKAHEEWKFAAQEVMRDLRIR